MLLVIEDIYRPVPVRGTAVPSKKMFAQSACFSRESKVAVIPCSVSQDVALTACKEILAAR